MRKFLAVWHTSLRNALAARGILVANAVTMAFRLGFTVAIYLAAYRAAGGNIRGMSLAASVWSMGVYFVILSFGVRRLASDISEDVKTGAIEVRTGRPLAYLPLVAGLRLGRGVPVFVLTLLIVSVIAFVATGIPPLSIGAWEAAGAFLLLLGGFLVALCVFALVGLAAFWIVESDPVFWIVDKLAMILGGSYVPVALFPDWLKAVADWSPFGGMYAAARVFSPEFQAILPRLLVVQACWVALCAGALAFLWGRASRRLSIHGG